MNSIRREKAMENLGARNVEAPYEEVIRRNSAAVYRLAYSLVKTRSDADDIYQEVFLKYMQKVPEFQNSEHEKAWFLRVTINLCRNFWKSPWMQRRAAMTSDGMDDAALVYEVSGEDSVLIDTVKQLPNKYRVVIHLFYYEDLSIEEIRKITGAKASTVRTRLTRARRLLKDLLCEGGENINV